MGLNIKIDWNRETAAKQIDSSGLKTDKCSV